jgi:hypothetical protein
VAVGFMNSNPARFGLDLPTSNWFIFQARFEDGTGLDTVIPSGATAIKTFFRGFYRLLVGNGSGWAGSPDL